MKSVISVLMPVYNAEKYLREAIDSVLAQTFPDFDFLIIDDGSTDSSVEIIKSYNDPRIRLFRNEQNVGITATLNKGIQLASNELIARMDADDICYPERLDKQYHYMQQHPGCAFVSSWVRNISGDGEFGKISGHNPKFSSYLLLFKPAGIFHPTVVFRKSAVLDVGCYTESYAEDFNLWCKLVKKYNFSLIPEPLVFYRASETSLWRVSKKLEYEVAHEKQIIENVRYYTQDTCQLADYEVKFLKGNMNELLSLQSKSAIFECFRKLDYITACFKSYKKENRSEANFDEAAFFYKKVLFKKLASKMNRQKLLTILVRLNYWRLLGDQLLQKTTEALEQFFPSQAKKTERRFEKIGRR